jgi:hypothetical protein
LGDASTSIEGSNWVIRYLDEFLEETLVFAKAKTVKEKGSDLTEVVNKEIKRKTKRKTKRKILFTPLKSGLTVVSGVLDALRALPLLNLYISLTLTLTLLSLYAILSVYTISILLGQIKWLSKGS